MEPIILRTKQDLDVYINPRRQSILRCMRIAGGPMTPKQISDLIDVSPSSVQHHIAKLASIGVVELDHTESIHGITARYYRVTPATVSVGLLPGDDLQDQRLAALQNEILQTASGYVNYCRHDLPGIKPGEQFGDMLNGILHLEPRHARELYAQITDFIQRHEQKTERSAAWEYALIAYPVREEDAI